MLINLKQAEDIWKSSFLQYDMDTWLTVGNNCLIKINCSCQNFLRWLWRSLDKNGLLPIKTYTHQSRYEFFNYQIHIFYELNYEQSKSNHFLLCWNYYENQNERTQRNKNLFAFHIQVSLMYLRWANITVAGTFDVMHFNIMF